MEELRKIYGDSYLRYVLVLNDSEGQLSEGQQQAVSLLQSFATSGTSDESESLSAFNLAHRLNHYIPDYGMTVSSALRLQSGGELKALEHSDDLTQELLVLARDTWPIYLLPPPKEELRDLAVMQTYSHPSSQEFLRLALRDDAIRKLFPAAPEQLPDSTELFEIKSEIVYSSGRGGSYQLAMLPDAILNNARCRQLLKGDSDNLDTYLACVIEVLGEVRELAQGKEIAIPVLVGLANMTVPDGARVVTELGIIRSPRLEDEHLLNPLDEGHRQPTAVLETTQPLKILGKRDWNVAQREASIGTYFKKFMPLFEQYQQRSERNVILMRYALLLASDNTLLAPAPIIRTEFGPLQPLLNRSWMPFVGQPSGISTLDADAAERTRVWAARVEKQHPAQLDLGVRRLVAAASTRLDPIDSFIDAVICWENMFGSSSESTFRICGAMACLLEPFDSAKRLTVYESLRKLYGIRSNVVHGVTELTGREASDYRTEAVRYALDAMGFLYDYPDLLKTKGSAERGRDVLLASGLPMEDEAEQQA